jgi:hypothetical protein
METIDMDRLKTGEVNLGVRCRYHFLLPAKGAQSDRSSYNQNVYTDFNHGRPIRRWRYSRRRQPDDNGELHRASFHIYMYLQKSKAHL